MAYPKKAIFAFNANIDYVKAATESDLEKIAAFSPDISARMDECFSWGVQKEVRIDAKQCDFFVKKGEFDAKIVGGQAGNAAEQASALGVQCFLHGNSNSGALLSLFSHPKNVLVPQGGGFAPLSSTQPSAKSAYHFVFENRENGTRFIASYDPLPLHIEDDFSHNVRQALPSLERAFVGGLHLLKSATPVHKFAEEIMAWKESNPAMRVFLELGEFQSPEVLGAVKEQMFPLADFVGLNNVELSGLGAEPEEVAEQVPLLFHTPEKQAVYPQEKKDGPALGFARRCASYKAKFGRCATADEIEKYSAEFVQAPIRTVGLGDVFSCAYFMACEKF